MQEFHFQSFVQPWLVSALLCVADATYSGSHTKNGMAVSVTFLHMLIHCQHGPGQTHNLLMYDVCWALNMKEASYRTFACSFELQCFTLMHIIINLHLKQSRDNNECIRAAYKLTPFCFIFCSAQHNFIMICSRCQADTIKRDGQNRLHEIMSGGEAVCQAAQYTASTCC